MCLFPGFSLLLQQNSPTDQPRLPEELSFAPSHPLWMGEGVKPQLPAPLPCSGGFIEGDLLLKPRPQSPSVWSWLPETGISFRAPSPLQSCHCDVERVVPDAAPWRGWSGLLASQQGWEYFKVTGALCKQTPCVRDQRQTPHPSLNLEGLGSPRPGLSCC